jgi:parallel beta-helix repeat protein
MSSSNNSIVGNKITNNNYYGIYLAESSNNTIYHNSFVDNGEQVSSFESVNVWDNDYPLGGNYWSDYDGADSNYDSIGDTPYFIDANNQDNYPLMGMFSSFNTSYEYAVDFVSNSSISDVSFNLSDIEVYPPEATLTFNVSGEADSEGFLRVCIPKVLINGSYVIRFDDQIITNITYPQIRELPCSNETHVYFYINYTHSEHAIIITGTTMIPEFPSLLILPLLMTATLLAIIVSKKKVCINTR